MTTYSPRQIDLMEKRAQKAPRAHYLKVTHQFLDPETNSGVIVGIDNLMRRGEIKAVFYRGRQINRGYKEFKVQSAHEIVGLLDKLKSEINAQKAEKVAPHDFKVGEILASVWGATMRDVHFYQVVDIPHPRKVTLASLSSKMIEGDWMAGKKMPVLPKDGQLSDGQTAVYDAFVKNGTSYVNCKSDITNCRRWDGEPVFIHCD
jgi:hypothetical protein